MASLSVVTSLSLAAGPAAAQSKGNGGGGGGKPTTTTTPAGSPTTTTAPGGGTSGGTSSKLVAAVSLSRHRVLATYNRTLDTAALDVASYAIYSTQAVNLPVTAVSRASDNQVFLTTAAQEAVTYEMRKPRTPKPVTFQGSVAEEPKVLSARALSSTQIVIVFSEPMGAGADQPANYHITVAGGTQTLAVEKAVVTGNQVVLTTAPQQAVPYVLKVVNIQSLVGVYVDPTATDVTFTGSTIPDGPMLLNAQTQGDTALLLTFDRPVAASATEVSRYTSTPGFTVKSAVLQGGGKQVLLTTSPLYDVEYTVTANVVDVNGNVINPNFSSVSFIGLRVFGTERPKVTSAISTGNTAVVVQFSKPMADNAKNPGNYFIVQQNMNPEVAYVPITAAAFVDENRLSVRLTTRSQNETTYQVTATNVTDVMGSPLADKLIVNGVLVADPTSFVFPGTAPTGSELKNGDCLPGDDADDDDPATYCDTLYDHQEYFGWQITVTLANGQTATRQVSSNPDVDDSDDDGLTDDVEKALNIDPRDNDTDDDGLGDYQEFNEYFSDPTNQDSDKDGLYDGLEATFFFTSPLFDDTDGDQLKDGYEINVNRNAKVADLPQPVLTLGDMRLGLDVRFTESNGTSTRELESKRFESVLSQSQSQEFSRSEATSHELSTKLGIEAGYKLGWEAGLFKLTATHEVSFGVNMETSNTNSWSSDFTAASSQSTQKAYTDSLTTDQEVASDSNVTRDVFGGRVQIGVFLEGRGNVAFNVRNLQIAALIQDPDNPSTLTPIATLLPDSEPATGFSLGPLVAAKGPIIFSNTDASPELVQQLMQNPRGLVFRFSNYDIVDEAGRNFAFTSQDINDRTARIALDYGGFDANGDGRGEETEILRVATGIIGRRTVDTNGDKVIDDKDRKVVFDTSGKQVGITLRDALEAAGLTWYDEATKATNTLSAAEKRGSFSTLKRSDGVEVVFRVRDRMITLGTPREWLIVTPNGIDPNVKLDDRILFPGSSVTLAFAQDLDQDRLPALTEAVHGCIDGSQKGTDGKFVSRDTDKDGLDDRFEVLVGWQVDTPLNSGRARSSCHSTDTDGDTRADRDEAPGVVKYDAAGLVLFDDGIDGGTGDQYVAANAPTRNMTGTADPVLGFSLLDYITDPANPDTDLDGLEDGFELTPYQNAAGMPTQVTSPEHPDSDFDSLSDGVERRLGSNPRLDDRAGFWDSDRDGLTDAQEVGDDNRNFVIDPAEIKDGAGWDVVLTKMHPRTSKWNDICWDATCPAQPQDAARKVYSSKFDADTDDDGLSDFEEWQLKTDPGNPGDRNKDSNGDGVRDGLDTDGDGLTDFDEVKGFRLRDGSVVKTKPTFVDTDNDKRSDGEEADLPQFDIIIVAVQGKAPYQSFSHPLKADTDLDFLVDGDEQVGDDLLWGFGTPKPTDPAKADTDGDGRNDYSEIEADGVRRPLVPDLFVEVIFDGISVAKTGDGTEAGEIHYTLSAGKAVLPPSNIFVCGACGNGTVSTNGQLDLKGHLMSMQSVSTTDTLYEEVVMNGTIWEMDSAVDCRVQFPGFVASPVDGPGRIAGTSLHLGSQPWNLHRKVTCSSGEEFEITLFTTIRAS